MDKYNLQPNEAIIMKSEEVLYGGMMAGYHSELVLTNLNIILVQKGTFGNTKGIQHFPISQIKQFNGKAQAMVAKQSNGSPKLELYFSNGQESFGFQKKQEVERWIDNINRLLSGETEFSTSDKKAIPGTEFVAETLKGTIDSFKGVFKKPVKEEKILTQCSSCGAQISGIKGRIVRCQYCGSEELL